MAWLPHETTPQARTDRRVRPIRLQSLSTHHQPAKENSSLPARFLRSTAPLRSPSRHHRLASHQHRTSKRSLVHTARQSGPTNSPTRPRGKNRAEGRPVMLLRRLRKIALALAGEFRDFGSPPCAPSPEAAGWVGRGPSARDKRMEGRGKLGWDSAVRSIARPRPYSGIADTFWTRRLSPRRPFLSAPQLQLPNRFLACFVRAMLLHIQSMCPGICEAT